MRIYYKMFLVHLILLFSLIFVVQGVNVISELVSSCTKGVNYGQHNMSNAIDFFIGNEIVASLDATSFNYVTYANMFYPGNGIVTIPDTSVNQQILYESVCGNSFGIAYANLGGLLGYNLSEIENYHSLSLGSLYIEAFNTIGLGGYFFDVQPKSAYVAYKINGASSYINETNPGPTITHYFSQSYNTPTGIYKNAYIFVDPNDNYNRFLLQFNLIGPMPSLNSPTLINATLNSGYGQILSATYSIPVPQSGYHVYHAQAVDNMGVGVTQWIIVVP